MRDASSASRASLIAGSVSLAFTLAYLKLSSILNGTCMKLTCALPSARRRRGSQNLPSCSPYSTAIAEISAFIGVIIGLTHTGTSSIDFGSSCCATAQMSIGIASAIRGADELAGFRVEPERADGEIPFWLARTNSNFAELDHRLVRKREADRIAGLVGVVRFGAVGDRIDDLRFVDLGTRHVAADPERLVSGEVRNRGVHVGIGHFVAHFLAHLVVRDHGDRRALAARLHPHADALLPLHARRALVSEQQAVATDRA